MNEDWNTIKEGKAWDITCSEKDFDEIGLEEIQNKLKQKAKDAGFVNPDHDFFTIRESFHPLFEYPLRHVRYTMWWFEKGE